MFLSNIEVIILKFRQKQISYLKIKIRIFQLIQSLNKYQLHHNIIITLFHLKRKDLRDFPGGPAAKTPCFQYRGPGFNPWSGKQIPYAATKSSPAANTDQMYLNEDQRSCKLQLRPGTARQTNGFWGMTQRDVMGREVGGGFMFGNACKN